MVYAVDIFKYSNDELIIEWHIEYMRQGAKCETTPRKYNCIIKYNSNVQLSFRKVKI
jgi:hypothetical protein